MLTTLTKTSLKQHVNVNYPYKDLIKQHVNVNYPYKDLIEQHVNVNYPYKDLIKQHVNVNYPYKDLIEQQYIVNSYQLHVHQWVFHFSKHHGKDAVMWKTILRNQNV